MIIGLKIAAPEIAVPLQQIEPGQTILGTQMYSALRTKQLETIREHLKLNGSTTASRMFSLVDQTLPVVDSGNGDRSLSSSSFHFDIPFSNPLMLLFPEVYDSTTTLSPDSSSEPVKIYFSELKLSPSDKTMTLNASLLIDDHGQTNPSDLTLHLQTFNAADLGLPFGSPSKGESTGVEFIEPTASSYFLGGMFGVLPESAVDGQKVTRNKLLMTGYFGDMKIVNLPATLVIDLYSSAPQPNQAPDLKFKINIS